MKNLAYFLTILLLFGSCICNTDNGYEFWEGELPEVPIALNQVNTEYNDYNMASPIIENFVFLLFSSDRISQGSHYDIVGGNIYFEWNRNDGILSVDLENSSYKTEYQQMAEAVNSEADEFGPTAYQIKIDDEHFENYLLYASDIENDTFSLYIAKQSETAAKVDTTVTLKLSGINQSFNMLYPTFYGAASDLNLYSYNELPEAMYFCTDKDGQFDIWRVAMPAQGSPFDFFASEEEKTMEKVSLSGNGNDKCPFITGEYLIFASDREGGFGGYDLYYSKYENGEWQPAVNFGPKINSEYNEYRPISTPFWEFKNDILLFSSDRPGGKGGYDLYYVGTDALRDESD